MLCEEYHRHPDLNFVNTCKLFLALGHFVPHTFWIGGIHG